jgi:CxxC motif-containing protein
MTREIICVACPMGCGMLVEYTESGEVTQVTGNTCKRGAAYAQAEIKNPTRSFHSTVRVDCGKAPLVSVKTTGPVPKTKLMDCAAATKTARAKAPVAIGDVIVANICGTGVDLVATTRIKQQELGHNP